MRRRAFLTVAASLAVIAGLDGSANPATPPGFLGAFTWRMDDARFGGISGIEVDPDGGDFLVLSDRATLISGRFRRDGDGRIAGIASGPVQPLKGKGDLPMQGPRADSEGLALGADGAIYVSFEGAARVLRYPRIGGSPENLPSAADFRRMQTNSALEALAIAPDGVLYTLPERSGATDKPFAVYRLRQGTWDKRLAIARRGPFLPVAADIGPDGRFYLLERDFRGLAGFASRLRRFDLGAKALSGEVTLLETPSGLHDNLEGLSVWRDAAGRLTATMISDDNFNFLLRTQIVEYRLPD